MAYDCVTCPKCRMKTLCRCWWLEEEKMRVPCCECGKIVSVRLPAHASMTQENLVLTESHCYDREACWNRKHAILRDTTPCHSSLCAKPPPVKGLKTDRRYPFWYCPECYEMLSPFLESDEVEPMFEPMPPGHMKGREDWGISPILTW